MVGQPAHFYICRKSDSGLMEFWNHETHKWQKNDPSAECQYGEAKLAYTEFNTHIADMTNAWVGNNYFQTVDKNGDVIKPAAVAS